MQKYLATKLVLSADPSTDPNCVALLFCDCWRRMAVCRLGDEAWTPVKCPEFKNLHKDAVFYKGKFRIVCRRSLYVLNLGQEPEIERVPIANPPFDEASTLASTEIDECFFVESSGDLLLLNMCRINPCEYGGDVYMVGWGLHRVKLLKITDTGSLGGLFLGRRESCSLSASRLPEFRGYIEWISGSVDDNTFKWQPCAWFMPSLLG